MKKNSVQFAIDIKTTTGSVLKPSALTFWDLKSKSVPENVKSLKAHKPFMFYTDAILALCFHQLSHFKFVSSEEKSFVENAYSYFDHYSELFHKSSGRVKALAVKKANIEKSCHDFEKDFSKVLDQVFAKNTITFADFGEVLEKISLFEAQISSPLIYNFSVHFNSEFTKKLTCLYSFLFHLRSLVAVDHNANAEDSSHESVTCDSISDYLAKSDYTVNDALLFWHFKKLSRPFVDSKTGQRNIAVENQLVNPMINHFQQYNHNACHLIEQLPANFLNSLADHDLEEALHHVQMDWLLGSNSGLLFKIREELYGVTEGYEKIFWTHCNGLKARKPSVLTLCFELNSDHIQNKGAA